MKFILLSLYCIFLSFSLPGISQAKTLNIQGSQIELTENCHLNVTYSNKQSKTFKLNLPENLPCKIINHSNTNIIQLEQITNYYIFLVEANLLEKDQCRSTYTAVAVSNKGEVIISPKNKRSGSCNTGRERKVFEYFAYKMKILK